MKVRHRHSLYCAKIDGHNKKKNKMNFPLSGIHSTSAPFTFIRSRSTLDSIFSDAKKILLCAPPGSGKTLALRQWLHAHRYCHEWIAQPPLADESAVQSGDLPLSWLQDRTAVSPVCRIVTLDDGDALFRPPVDVLCDLARSSRLVAVVQRLSPDALQRAQQTGFRIVDANRLALTLEEIQQIVNLSGAGVAESGLSACLHALSRGWPALLFALVWNGFTNHAQCRARAQAALASAVGEPGLQTLKAVSIVHELDGIPAGPMLGDAAPDRLRQGVVDACTTGLLSLQENAGGAPGLHCSVLGELLLEHGRQVNVASELDALINGLQQQGQQAVALPLLLRSGRLDQAEQAILALGDTLISRLQIDALFGWILALDACRGITHPMILMLAVRCAFYAGKRSELKHFFEKLTHCLHPPAQQACWQALPVDQGQRLLAEYRLFARVVDPRAVLPAEPAQAFAFDDTSGDLFTLLQRALHCAEQGELVTALPMIESGIRRTGVTRQLPLHVIFSLLTVWVLVLSCQLRQAETFLRRLKQTLSQQSVIFLGIYEWLDVMDVLLLRIQGDICGADQRLTRFLEQESFTSDFQKHYLLLNIKADIALAQRNDYEARHCISKLANLQQASAKRSYWFACADVMKAVLDALEGLPTVWPDVTPVPEPADLPAQTATLWSLKRQLFLDRDFDPLPVLEPLYVVFAQNGQWLRLLEVDALRAVFLFRQGEVHKATDLFGKVFEQLDARGLLGALIDPFLLWGELLQGQVSFAQRQRITEFHDRLKPQSGVSAMVVEAPSAIFQALSKREKQVLERVAQGLSNLEIAGQLCVSITTVRTHLQNIYRKLDVYNRTEAAAMALKYRLVK